jgi:hypothetical protein
LEVVDEKVEEALDEEDEELEEERHGLIRLVARERMSRVSFEERVVE